MTASNEFNEIKQQLTSCLQGEGLSDVLINELLSDNFINGLVELKQQNTQENSFLAYIKSLSNTISLADTRDLEREFKKEITKNGYVAAVFQYMVDAWREINISPLTRSTSENNVQKAGIIGIAGWGFLQVSTPAKFILGEVGLYSTLVKALDNQEKSVWQEMLRRIEYEEATLRGTQSNYQTADDTPSPLAIDLDGDGVETVGTSSNVFFDHDGNGFAENTGWIGKDDGILVRDLNENGQIDSGAELFGNNTVLSNGQKAANGFEALKDLDSNNDGVFNSQDTAWGEVKVWKDANQNGAVDEGELMTLAQAGVSGINLSYNQQNTTDTNGNNHAQVGTVTKTDGTSGTVTDVWFDADYANTIDKTEVTISDDIKALPEVEGFGNVHSLQTAMALDTSGALKTLVQQFMAETDIAARDVILNNLIYHWAGVQNMDPNGRDPTQYYEKVIDDTRKVEALEEFLGEDFLGTWCWGERDPNPHGKAAPLLLKAFDDLKGYINYQLLAQSHYKTLLESIQLTYNDQTQTWSANVDTAIATLRTGYNQDNATGLAVLHEFGKLVSTYGSMGAIVAEAFQDEGSVEGTVFDAELLNFGLVNYGGTSGNDTIEGDDNANYLTGQGGNDRLFGNGGNDILVGGAGDDYLNGGNGADTYRFAAGFGHDTLDNSDDNASAEEPDVVEFGEGILKKNVSIERQGFDLILRVSYDADEDGNVLPDDTLRIYSYFDQQGTSSATVNYIKFADGTSWDYDYIIANWNSVPDAGGGVTLEGDRYDNTLNGTAYDDVLIGHAGVDTIYGNAGNDRILGGRGNDNLNGGAGDDIYIWNWGDGMDRINDSGNHDRISFGSGISYADLKFRQEGNDLRIIVKNDETQGMLIVNYFYPYGTTYRIEELYFYDGTLINLSEAPLVLQQFDTAETIRLTDNGDTVYGNGGFDSISGGVGNDTIIGGKGNDSLSGGNGNDTYVWNLGDGLDTISDSAGDNVIQFGAGITFDDLAFRRVSNNNLEISVKGDRGQGVVISSFFYGSGNSNKLLKFADGSSFDLETNGLTLTQDDTDDNVSGTDYDDVIYGNGGKDTLNGGAGNDTLIGGKGNDSLYGGNGNDTYVWNLGDGLDTISDSSGNDIIQFGADITFDDLAFRRVSNNNLEITVNGDRGQGVVISSFFYGSGNSNKLLKFADGSSHDLAVNGLTLIQGNADDNMSGTNYDDVIYGHGGDDTINGSYGNDTLIGGKGNDYLDGSWGNDTYIWNLGDGLDTISDTDGENEIHFGEGISFSDLSFSRNVNNLNITVNGNQNQGLIIVDYFYYSSRRKQTLKFVDGTSFNLNTNGLTLIQSNADDNISATDYNDVIYGHGGDDTINGAYGNDTLIGGKGNDYLDGSWGNDTYIWNLGDGLDTISDSDGENIIQFGEGISFSDLSFSRNVNNLNITVNGNQNQGLIIVDYFYYSSRRKQTLKFVDGTSFNLNTNGLTLQQSDVDDNISGTDYNDVIYGHGGDDSINGAYGNDTLIGGKGNDYLDGSWGNDTYIWNLGDGLDTISDSDGENIIQFGEGISFSDLSFSRNVNNLNITVNGNQNQGLIIVDYFYYSSRRKQTLKFVDGTSFNLDGAELTLVTFPQLTLNGDDDDNELTGGIGNDIINSGDGYNDITGGKGNDTINGGYDNDTYYYNLGDGADTISDPRGNDKIVFGAGITANDITYRRAGNHLRLIVDGDENQSITIDKFFSDGNYRIETLKFADGTVKNIATSGLTLDQTDGAESISGTAYNDVIYGRGGNDTINAGAGNDTIVGGTGNDTLDGGVGDDTYVWNLGDGLDKISDSQGQDKIVFGTGITLADLKFVRQGSNLRIIVGNDESQGILISNHFSESSQIEQIEFADGTVKNIATSGLTLDQTDGAESISGTAYNDIIYGNGGHDTINAGAGNDTIVGGTGNDTLDGGVGDDTYVWNLGDGLDKISDSQGQDKIVFGAGITSADLRFVRQGSNLRIIVGNDESQGILISNHFSETYQIEKIEFADGSDIMLTDAGLTLNQTDDDESITGTAYDDVIYGNGGHDTINGGDGNDILAGGKGNDILYGGVGRDTYLYNLGDGADVIYEERGNDKIVFGAGITFNDLAFCRKGSALVITLNGDESQSITINDFYLNVNNQVEKLEFADGSVFNLSTSGLTLQQTNGDESISGTVYNDVIYGNGGNDTINAGDGDDTLIGGTGNDTLNGGAGDDTYVWNLGDGFDMITENGGNDKIVFGAGISQSNLSFVKIGSALKIIVNGDEVQGLQITEHFNTPGNKVETIEFADGSTMDISAADQLVQAMSSFSLANSASTDTLSNPVQDVSEMYDNFASGNPLSREAV